MKIEYILFVRRRGQYKGGSIKGVMDSMMKVHVDKDEDVIMKFIIW